MYCDSGIVGVERAVYIYINFKTRQYRAAVLGLRSIDREGVTAKSRLVLGPID